MNLPGFTGEASIYESHGHYGMDGRAGDLSSSVVTPARYTGMLLKGLCWSACMLVCAGGGESYEYCDDLCSWICGAGTAA